MEKSSVMAATFVRRKPKWLLFVNLEAIIVEHKVNKQFLKFHALIISLMNDFKKKFNLLKVAKYKIRLVSYYQAYAKVLSSRKVLQLNFEITFIKLQNREYVWSNWPEVQTYAVSCSTVTVEILSWPYLV